MVVARGSRRILFVHPSAELYGSDRQLLTSASVLLADGWEAAAALSSAGPMAEELAALGVEVSVVPSPVLRKALLRPRALAGLAATTVRALPEMVRTIREQDADLVYVNTLTIPWWLAAARAARVPVLCHVHEAESQLGRVLATGLNAPLLLAHSVITNSEASATVLRRRVPSLAGKIAVVHNGVPGPAVAEPLTATRPARTRLVLVGRLSPRKGTDLALRALELLLRRGHDVELDLVGGTYPGYEWYEDDMRAQAAREPLRGRVRFCGFAPDVWSLLEASHVALVPSRLEPFGNVAVEAMLARRPVVASRAQGLQEIVDDGVNGLLCDVDDPRGLALAVERLLLDWPTALSLAETARTSALDRFGVERYGERLCALADGLVRRDEPAPSPRA